MKDRDDIVFGSLIALVANVIAFLCCFFGGRNELLWLCIIGFVVFGIGMLVSFANVTTGLINLVASVIMIAVGHFVGEKLVKIYTWFVVPNSSGVFYFNGLLLMAMVTSALILIINISSNLRD